MQSCMRLRGGGEKLSASAALQKRDLVLHCIESEATLKSSHVTWAFRTWLPRPRHFCLAPEGYNYLPAAASLRAQPQEELLSICENIEKLERSTRRLKRLLSCLPPSSKYAVPNSSTGPLLNLFPDVAFVAFHPLDGAIGGCRTRGGPAGRREGDYTLLLLTLCVLSHAGELLQKESNRSSSWTTTQVRCY